MVAPVGYPHIPCCDCLIFSFKQPDCVQTVYPYHLNSTPCTVCRVGKGVDKMINPRVSLTSPLPTLVLSFMFAKTCWYLVPATHVCSFFFACSQRVSTCQSSCDHRLKQLHISNHILTQIHDCLLPDGLCWSCSWDFGSHQLAKQKREILRHKEAKVTKGSRAKIISNQLRSKCQQRPDDRCVVQTSDQPSPLTNSGYFSQGLRLLMRRW